MSAAAIIRAQIAAATGKLQGKAIPAAAIHASRREIQKARATLRLIRKALPGKTFGKEDRALREAAHELNAIRDAHVLIQTLDRLLEANDQLSRPSVATLRRTLVRCQEQARSGARGCILRARRILREVHGRTERWSAGEVGWTVVCRGLKKTYARGRRALAAARTECSSEDLHAWRKQVKYLRHQLDVVNSGQPGPVSKLAKRAHRLSDRLGDDHDLANLHMNVVTHGAMLDERTEHRLLMAIRRRRTRLQKNALRLGARLYHKRPRRFTRRIRNAF